MNRLQIRQLIIIRVDARAEKQPCVPSIHDLRAAAEFDEVGLVFLVARRDKAVDLRVADIGIRLWHSSGLRGGASGTCEYERRRSVRYIRVHYLALELYFLIILVTFHQPAYPVLSFNFRQMCGYVTYRVGRVPLRQACLASVHASFSQVHIRHRIPTV